MHRNYKKYLIATLSIMLVLSNFSFVTAYSICSMGEMKENCGCKNETKHESTGLALSKVKKNCCEERVIELSNSNTLSIDKSFLNDWLVNLSSLTLNGNSLPDNSTFLINHFTFPDKIPKDGIPISISSLLI